LNYLIKQLQDPASIDLEIMDALSPLFDNTENFFKNHKIDPPQKNHELEKKGDEDMKEEDSKGQDAEVSGWDNEPETETPPIDTPGEPRSNNQNEDLRMEDDHDSNKADDEGHGEHITEEIMSNFRFYLTF